MDDAGAEGQGRHRRRTAKPDRAAVLGHEMRGPLGVVMTLSEMLLARDLPADERRLLELIRLAGRHALGVAEDLVAEASVEADALRVAAEPFDPAATLRDTAALFGPLTEGAGRRILVEVAPGVPAVIAADEGRVRQVLFNLISNAVRHTPSGTIRVALTTTGERVVFLVVDEGGGGQTLTSEPAPFRSGDDAGHGAGLGLWISERLAEALGGALSFDTGPSGTTARLALPLAPPPPRAKRRSRPAPGPSPRQRARRKVPAEPAAAAPQAARRPADWPLAGRTALVVDDSPVSRMLMTAILTSFEMTVATAASGADAAAVLAARPVDVMLLDWSLPGETAPDVMARLAGTADVLPPAITVSADAHVPAVPGVAAHVPKPFSPSELYAALDAAVFGRAGEAATAG